MLSFTNSNVKLEKLEKLIGKKVFAFSLRSGHTCPYAKECHSRAINVRGKMKIKDGEFTKFRCYSASQEALYKHVYTSRHINEKQLKKGNRTPTGMMKLLEKSLPKNIDDNVVRIHVGGDFFSQDYFDSWILLAERHPSTIFYAYTKSLPFWVRRLNIIPDNFILTASWGGYKDDLITKHNLRSAIVVYSEQEAIDLGLEIDINDSHAYDPAKRNQSFALLVHGTQPAKNRSKT